MIGPLPGGGVVLADDKLTLGSYELFEMSGPAGFGPPLHVHREREEGFYVISGSFGFWCDGAVREAEAGEFVLIPRGAQHRFEARGEGSRLVFIVSPPGLEAFFREGDAARAAGEDDMEIRRRLSARFDSHPIE